MADSLSLRKNFVWAFASNVINALGQWVMLVILAKMSSVEDVGSFGFAVAVSAPVIMLANLNLSAVYVTDAAEHYQFGEYMTLRLLTVIAAFFTVLGIVFLGKYDKALMILILSWCLAQCALSIKDLYLGIMQKHERMDKIFFSRIIQTIFSIGGFFLVLYFFKSLNLAVLAVVIGRTLPIFIYDLPISFNLIKTKGKNNFYELLPNFRITKILKLFWLAAPLGVVMFLTSLNSNIPRYFIEHYQGSAELGYFTALSSFMTAGNLTISALAQSAIPRLAVYYKDNLRGFRILLVKLGFFGLAIGIAGVLVSLIFGKLILLIFFKPEYTRYNNILILLMFSAIPWYISSFLYDGLLVARRIKIQIPLTIISIITVLVFCVLLVPRFSQSGAAISIFMGFFIALLGTIVVLISAYKEKSKDLTM